MITDYEIGLANDMIWAKGGKINNPVAIWINTEEGYTENGYPALWLVFFTMIMHYADLDYAEGYSYYGL